MGTVTIEKKRPVRRKKRISVKAILLVTILQLTIVMYLGCMMIFYGPFPTLRRYIVNTAMATYSHQYIAQAFLSNDQIQRIISEGTSTFDIEQNESGVTIKNSGSKNVEVYKINGSQYEGYMLVVSDPFRVKVGYSNQLGKQGQTTSAIAKENNAIAAINGGGFNDSADSGRLWAGTGANPTGFLISGGEIIFKDRSLGKNQKLSVMAMDENGKLIVGKHSINELMKRNVNEAITFGPALVINGKAAFRGDGGQGMNPRTAIGQRNDGSILLLALDGRRLNMLGATLRDVQKIMMDYGAYNATNLDGGSSTTMYYNGKVLNNPCNLLGERTVASAVYVEK